MRIIPSTSSRLEHHTPHCIRLRGQKNEEQHVYDEVKDGRKLQATVTQNQPTHSHHGGNECLYDRPISSGVQALWKPLPQPPGQYTNITVDVIQLPQLATTN